MESFCGRRGRGEKLDLLLRMRERCFLIVVDFFNNTWTGDTHKETDILPSTRQDEDSRQQVNFSI